MKAWEESTASPTNISGAQIGCENARVAGSIVDTHVGIIAALHNTPKLQTACPTWPALHSIDVGRRAVGVCIPL